MSDSLLSILYDHYKDTCSIIDQAVKKRDRTMLFVILAVSFFAFQTIFPNTAESAVTGILTSKVGLPLKLNPLVIGNVVWLLVLLFTLRYFQTNVFLERQYAYIHHIEDALNKEIGREFVTREGKSYLTDYPPFSDWMHIQYTMVFPAILCCVTTYKILYEWFQNRLSYFAPGILFDTLIFLLLIFSVILYLRMIHKKPNDATE